MASFRKTGKNSYQFRASAGLKANGDYNYRYKTYHPPRHLSGKKLKEHLEYEAYKFEEKILSGNYIAPTKLTFKGFSKEWQKNWLEKEVSENTIALRLGSLKNHILPVIGNLKMSQITTMMLVNLINNLSRKDGQKGELSVSSKQEVYKVLMSIFKRAVEWNVLKNNPMEKVHMPREVRTRVKDSSVYSVEEINILMDLLRNEPAPYHWYIFIRLAIATGMRRGELLGLEWNKVNLDKGIIKVRQQLSKDRNKGHNIIPPKVGSRRSIHLPVEIIKDLKKYKSYCRREKVKLQHKWAETNRDWVFFTEEGTHFHIDTPTKWWRRFLKRNEFKLIRLHDLRHTSATMLIEKDVNLKIISERLGHSKFSTTMDIYGHVTDMADKKASDKLNSIFI